MALYREDIVDIDLAKSGSLLRSYLNRNIGKADNLENRFGIRLFRDGAPVDLSSASCLGFFMAPDGQHIAITGPDYTGIAGNVAWVQLPQACYNVDGQFTLAIKVSDGIVTGTMRIVDGVVNNTGVDGAVAPVDSVPTYQEVLSVFYDVLNVRYIIPVDGVPGIVELYLNENAVADGIPGGLLFAVHNNESGAYFLEFSNSSGTDYTAITITRRFKDTNAIPVCKYNDYSRVYGYVIVDWDTFDSGVTYPRKGINYSTTVLAFSPSIQIAMGSYVIGCPGITEMYLNEAGVTAGIDKGLLFSVHKNDSNTWYLEFSDSAGANYNAKTISRPTASGNPIEIVKHDDNSVVYGYVVVDWDYFNTGLTYLRQFIGDRSKNLESSPVIMSALETFAFGVPPVVELYLNGSASVAHVDAVYSIQKNDSGVYRVNFSNNTFSSYTARSSALQQKSYDPIPIYVEGGSSLLGYIVVNWDKLDDGVTVLCTPVTDRARHIDLCPLIKLSVEGASDSRVDAIDQRVDTLEEEMSQVDTQAILQRVDTEVTELVSQQYTQDSVLFDNNPTQNHAAPYAVSSAGVWNAIHKRRIITCGDSYLMDYSFSWGHKLQEMLGLSNSDFYFGGYSGGGFISLPGTLDGVGNGFLLGIQQIENSVTSPETITDIIVCGGLNDSSFTPATFPTTTFDDNVEAFISYCKTQYPNARIWIGYCGNAVDSTSEYIGTRTIENRLYAIQKYSRITSDVPVRINTEIWKIFTYSYTWFNSTDWLHPTSASSSAIARAIMAWITGSPFAIQRSKHNITRTGFGTTLTGYSNINFDAFVDNGMMNLKLNPWYQQAGYSADFLGALSADVAPGSEIHIGNTADGHIFNKEFVTQIAMCYGNLTGAQKYAPATLRFAVGTGWYLMPFITETIPTGTNIYLCGSNVITIPAEYYV